MSTKKLVDLTNSLEHSFSEIVRKTMRQKFVARFAGNEELAMALDAEEQKMRAALHEARDRVFRVKLSDTNIDELVSALDDEAKAARKSLKNMQDLKNFLDKAKQAAQLAVSILETVSRIVRL